jgi:hypothetical protein
VAESDEDKPGVVLDYDQHGDLLAPEILDASRRVTDARKIEYETRSTTISLAAFSLPAHRRKADFRGGACGRKPERDTIS